MKKTAINIQGKPVLRYALGGAGVGLGTSALVNLVRMARQMNEERVNAAKGDETDEDTIVINLPPKRAQAVSTTPDSSIYPDAQSFEAHEPALTKVEEREGPMSGEMKAAAKKKPPVSLETTMVRETVSSKGNQLRHPSGKLGMKTTKKKLCKCSAETAGWPTLAASVLAGIGGTTVGYSLLNKIYAKQREKQLMAQLTAARTEYGDLLAPQPKLAESLDDIFTAPGLGKGADSTFGLLNYPLAAAAVLSVLGTGGTAYITKKLLDQKLNEAQGKGLDIPRPKRVVFRSSPVPEGDLSEDEKYASDADVECIKAALAVMVDKLDSESHTLNTESVKAAMAEAGTSPTKLFKLAQDAEALMSHLGENKDLRRMIQRAFMEKHPMLKNFKWSLGIPGISHLADRKLDKGMRGALGVDKQPAIKAADTEKAAVGVAADSVSDLLGSIMGSSMANKGLPDDIAEAIVKAQQKVEENRNQPTPEERASRIKVVAGDPGAESYVDANQDRIQQVMTEMARAKRL